jgi:hypothetical protein
MSLDEEFIEHLGKVAWKPNPEAVLSMEPQLE